MNLLDLIYDRIRNGEYETDYQTGRSFAYINIDGLQFAISNILNIYYIVSVYDFMNTPQDVSDALKQIYIEWEKLQKQDKIDRLQNELKELNK